ncbi:PIR Superfamily Protein [Plasmodium ovale wallikeri]|uniref:PIR Superfamily Protein n=2 Tax=Plasmodium ovale TaxID=36330 RepID=A0A1A9AD57_PLAOA|nr:PIR Superfamily Protein [Plasmodium ovale wallikeri]SBT54067.1 PIR Superfamily Protein [Plasmodium ovale wallikeri]SBT76560.1 PIR protein [Plasmodium ovale]
MSKPFNYKSVLRFFGESSGELFSERFYESMKYDYLNLSQYREKCKEVYASVSGIRSKRVCEKILRQLENSSVRDEENSEYDLCILLNYWVYDTLASIFGDDNSNLAITFGKLQPLWNQINENEKEPKFYKKCAPDSSIPTQVNWRKTKELYDYYVDFKTIFGTAAYYPDGCRDYYKKIEDKTSLYEFFEKLCTPGSNNCPKFYDKCEPYNPKIILQGLPCHGQIQQERATEKALAMQKSLQQSGSQGVGLTQQNSEIGTKVGHSVLAVAPVFLTASVLYRYTPVGSWIRNIGGNSTNNIGYMHEGEMEGFLSNTQESGDMFFNSGENYISYQPM